MNSRALVTATLVASFATGCFGGGGRGLFLGILAIDAAAHIAAATAPRPVIVVAEPSPVVEVRPAPPPPPDDTPVPPPPTPAPAVASNFDAVAAQTALSQIDPSRCWTNGSRGGYVKLNTYFTPGGYVGMVGIESTPPGPAPDNACLAETFRTATVPPFSGTGSVKVVARYFIAAR